MRWENLNVDALDPHRLAAFWAGALGEEPVTQEEDLAEIRVQLPRGRFLDLCFERVPDPSPTKSRVHPDLDVRQGPDDGPVASRWRGLGARLLIDNPAWPWSTWADPSGNEFCLLDPPPSPSPDA